MHQAFEMGGIFVGAQYYRMLKQKWGQGRLLEGTGGGVVVGCVFGALFGSRAVFFIESPHVFLEHWGTWSMLYGGQSVVGGFIGGLVGVEVGKWLVGHKDSTGDLFVFPVLVGLMIGRVGCFIAGLEDKTYGIASDWIWAVDFGDGIARHPVQLYEIGLCGLLIKILGDMKRKVESASGLLFKMFLCAYMTWRLLVEWIKPVPYEYIWGLSGIQLVCIVFLCVYGPFAARQWRGLVR